MTTYVDSIEPRLTPMRPVAPLSSAEALSEWCRDLDAELGERLRLMTPEELAWQPHADANSPAVTAWHVARWLDVLATRAFTGGSAGADLWHTEGWRDTTGYEPDGIGFLGLGTLTGYTPAEMRAVPVLAGRDLRKYLSQSVERLVGQITELGASLVGGEQPQHSPYNSISSTLQGSFGHVGEIDALVSLRSRLNSSR
jgi:DinB family protein